MPTAAKLVAAVFLAATGCITALLAQPHVAQSVATDRAVIAAIVVSAYCGWSFIGAAVGRGYRLALTTGVRGAMAAMALCLAGFAAVDTVHQAMQPPLPGLSALTEHFLQAFLTVGKQMLYAEVLLPMMIGAVVTGAVAEYVGRRWT